MASGKDAQEFIEEVFMGRVAIRIVAMNGSTVENLTLNAKPASASSLRLISQLLPKIHFSETQTLTAFFPT